jgi:hypothetical protein
LLAVLLAASALVSPVKSEHASALGVSATLSYVPVRFGVYYVRLVVDHGGMRVYDKRVQPYSRDFRSNQPLGVAFSPGTSIEVRDLDGDGEPEILVDFWTGGAHCCIWTRLYHWDGSTYASVVHWWGDTGYDIGGVNGEVVLESADDRFAYAFSSYAGSGFPIRIWGYVGGRLADTTKRYRSLVAQDATQMWGYYAEAKKDHVEVRGLLAAWAADECRLGRGARAIRWIRQHPFLFRNDSSIFVGSNAKFLRTLPMQLRRWGYPC